MLHLSAVNASFAMFFQDLNPLLQHWLPFNEQDVVHEFFKQTDRIGALTRYIGNVLVWNPHTFARQLVQLICSWDYRYNHSFPGRRLRYKKLVYIPKKFSDFLMATARLICNRSHGHFDEAKVLEQFQEAFQKNAVDAERKRASEMDVEVDKRKHPYEGFPDSDEETKKGEKSKMPVKAPPKKAPRKTGSTPPGGPGEGTSGLQKKSGHGEDTDSSEELREDDFSYGNLVNEDSY